MLFLSSFLLLSAQPNFDKSESPSFDLIDNKQNQPMTIGLALSGGGALGIAHVGVLKVLEQESIPINFIVGNSMGSVIGGFYAAGYSACQIESILCYANMNQLLSSEIPFGARYLPERQNRQRYVFQFQHDRFVPSLPGGLVPIQNAEFLFMQLLSKIEYDSYYDFDNLVIPFRTIAVDLKSGKKVALRNGRLAQAIRASMAVPGIFPPLRIGDYDFIDGGIISNLPVDLLDEFEPDLKIASLTVRKEKEISGSVIDVIMRSIDLIGIDDWEKQRSAADIVIEPNVDDFKNSDFSKVLALIQAGERSARAVLPQIRHRLAGHAIESTRKPMIKRKPAIINSIEFQGLKTTQEPVISSLMSLHADDSLDFKQLLADLTKIYYTGFFEHIDYDLEFNPEQDSVRVIIRLEEKQFGFYSLGVRYDNFDGLNLGLAVGQGNIKGSGADIRAAFNLGNPNEVRFGLTGTRLYRFPLGYRIDGFWRRIVNNYLCDCIWEYIPEPMQIQGGVIETGYIIGKNAFFNLGLTGYEAKYENYSCTSYPYQKRIIGPILRIEYNNLSDLDFPTRGFSCQIKGLYSSKALKASQDFWKMSLRAEQIMRLTNRIYSHPSFDIGISSERISWNEYFSSSELNYIGFEKIKFMIPQKLVLGHSFDIKLIDLFNHSDYPVYFQVFTTAASFVKYNDWMKLDNYHWSAGIGLKTNTPLGPMQINFGYAGMKGNYIDELKIAFAIGREFRYSED